MSNDDAPIGRLLSRREVLALAGASGVALAAHVLGTGKISAFAHDADLPSCVVRPKQTEGPYFVDERLNRADIRADPGSGEVRPGTPLDLTIRVSQVVLGGCTPVSGALVDVWHCDALGVYSDVEDPGFTTIGQKFLRGYQLTDASGKARFTTIYPGWYGTRAVHIHFKVRTSAASARAQEFVSQMYFPDSLSDKVHARPPYASKGPRRVRNQNDRIFRDGGEQLLLDVVPRGDGYASTFDIALALP